MAAGQAAVRFMAPTHVKSLRCSFPTKGGGGLRPALLDRLKNVRQGLGGRFHAQIAFAVESDADRVMLQFLLAEDEHGVDLFLFSVLALAVDFVASGIEFGADHVCPQFRY